MTRRLVLLRHATAVSAASAPSDHERSLTAHGTREALSTGAQLAALGWSPQHVLCSDAARTCETLWSLQEAIGDPPAQLLPALYGADVDGLVAAIKRVPDEISTILALGHNPGWSSAVGVLTGQRVALRPANAALLVGRGAHWSDVLGPGAMRLVDVVLPDLA